MQREKKSISDCITQRKTGTRGRVLEQEKG